MLPSLNTPRQTVADCGGGGENQRLSCGEILHWDRLWLPQLFTQPNSSLLMCGVPQVKYGEPWRGTKHSLKLAGVTGANGGDARGCHSPCGGGH